MPFFCSDRNCFSLDLMVDEEDCKEAFKLYDKDDSGVIPKDVSNTKPFFTYFCRCRKYKIGIKVRN